jgi:hypothetical protein
MCASRIFWVGSVIRLVGSSMIVQVCWCRDDETAVESKRSRTAPTAQSGCRRADLRLRVAAFGPRRCTAAETAVLAVQRVQPRHPARPTTPISNHTDPTRVTSPAYSQASTTAKHDPQAISLGPQHIIGESHPLSRVRHAAPATKTIGPSDIPRSILQQPLAVNNTSSVIVTLCATRGPRARRSA